MESVALARMNAGLGVVLKGFAMGAADVVPGVSGGTMALILGVYGRLLRAIRAFDLELVRLLAERRPRRAAAHVDLLFLLLLGAGIVAALAFFTRVVDLPRLIVVYPEAVYALFFGLVSGSIVVLVRSLGALRPADAAFAALGTATGLLVVTAVPFDTPEAAWFVFLSGGLAICAMILPGVSGAFVLLVLRKYVYVFDAIGRLDMSVLVPFGLGAVCGLMLFSRALVWLLRRHYRPTLLAIIGVLVASLWVIWPFQDRHYETVRGKAHLVHSEPSLPAQLDASLALPVALALAGLALVVALERTAGRRAGSD